MRPRTITVDISRGADYALAGYRRQVAEWALIRWMEREGVGLYCVPDRGEMKPWAQGWDDRFVGLVTTVYQDDTFVWVRIGGDCDERRN